MIEVDKFCELLKAQAERKEKLYDGVTPAHGEYRDVRFALALLTEEVGEIASALIRERLPLAEYESIDVAHCAFLVWSIIREMRGKRDIS